MLDKLLNARIFPALVIGFLVYFCFNASRVTTGIYIAFNQHSRVQLGLAMALYSVAPVFIAVRIGEMASYLGTGPLLVKGGVLFLIGLGVQAFAKSIVFVFLGALITGVAFTTLQIVLQLHIGESSVPQLRVRNFGYFSMAQSAANSIAAIMAGFISSQFGLQVPFGVNAGIA
ncbi:MAG: MFS transporter, partial [Advenella sp.]